MKKKLLSILLCLVMVVGSLPTAAFAAGYVEINETNFPDAKFRSFVKENLDKNKDDILDAMEIAAVKMIEANNMGIKSLEGVGFFTALETLKCWDNELTGLDLSKNTALKDLRSFMFDHVYRNPVAKGEESKAKIMLQRMFEYYITHPDALPEDFQPQLSFDGMERTVCDYIAGMTDNYAVNKFTEIFVPAGWNIRG